MPRSERAKQFAPFNPLRGLFDALRQKEQEVERISKEEITEEKSQKLTKILQNLNKNMEIEVFFYKNGHIFSEIGFASLDVENGCLCINRTKIKLTDIVDINEINKIENWFEIITICDIIIRF